MKEYRYVLKFSYDGSDFESYCEMPNKFTTEGLIIETLIENDIIRGRRQSNFQSGSRTDKGVSALENALAFNSQMELNHISSILSSLKTPVFFREIACVGHDFNPRHACGRVYQYYIPLIELFRNKLSYTNQNNVYGSKVYDQEKVDFHKNKHAGRLFNVPDIPSFYSQTEIDERIQRLKDILNIFKGTHDFINFSKARESTVRTIEKIDVEKKEDFAVITVKGNAFVWNMIRRIVAAALSCFNGITSPDDIKSFLNFAGDFAITTHYGLAPAEFLFLSEIIYENVDFIKIPIQRKPKAFNYLMNRYFSRKAACHAISESIISFITSENSF